MAYINTSYSILHPPLSQYCYKYIFIYCMHINTFIIMVICIYLLNHIRIKEELHTQNTIILAFILFVVTFISELFFFIWLWVIQWLLVLVRMTPLGLPRWLIGGRICLPMQETPVQSLGHQDPLEEETVTHSSGIPWTEVTGGLQPQGCRVRRDWTTEHICTAFLVGQVY